MTPPIQHVSDTAFLVAQLRAIESERPDALFHDPFAARLAGERGRAIAGKMTASAMSGWSIVMRTSVIDRFVAEAVAGGVDTIVNLGAGLDTRPYRLELPESLRWIEVDFAHVLEPKVAALAGETPRCRLEVVSLDLADRPARQAFFDGLAGRVLILTEGVLPYLTVDAVGSLADDLRAVGAVAGWLVDYISPAVVQARQRLDVDKDFVQAPYLFTPPDWHAFFGGHGWRARETRYLFDEGERVGRAPPLPVPMNAAMNVAGAIPPERLRDGLRKAMGYVLLEPAAAS
jgi:methyltransferase (TIGR00027 family)